MASVVELLDTMVVTRTSRVYDRVEVYVLYSELTPENKIVVELEDQYLFDLDLSNAVATIKGVLAKELDKYCQNLAKSLITNDTSI